MLKDGKFWTGVIVGAIFVAIVWPFLSVRLRGTA